MCETLENVHYLHEPKDMKEAITNPKVHWDDLEDRKVRLGGLDNRLQGQSTLDECMEEYGRGGAERKRCMAMWRSLRTAHRGSQVPIRSLLVDRTGITAACEAPGYYGR